VKPVAKAFSSSISFRAGPDRVDQFAIDEHLRGIPSIARRHRRASNGRGKISATEQSRSRRIRLIFIVPRTRRGKLVREAFKGLFLRDSSAASLLFIAPSPSLPFSLSLFLCPACSVAGVLFAFPDCFRARGASLRANVTGRARIINSAG